MDEEKIPQSKSVKQWQDRNKKEKTKENKKPGIIHRNREYSSSFYSSINNSDDIKYEETHKVAESVKLAVIRGDGLRECPFGLPITSACSSVGDVITKMAPIEPEDPNKEKLTKANKLVYLYHRQNKKCPYASKILEGYKKVDCNYGDTAQGFGDPAWNGSPLYVQTFNGLDASGLNSQPLGFYAQNDISRNLFFGIFSLLGGYTQEELIKTATKYMDCNELEKSNILNNLLDVLEKHKQVNPKDFEQLENYLKDYKDCLEKDNMSTGLLYNLSERWFGPRQDNYGK